MHRLTVILLIVSTLLRAQEKISYDDHILPIFEQSCLNCHNPDKNKGGLDLSNYTGAIKGGSSGKVVEPGDTSSKMVTCVKQTAEPEMPPEGEKLSADQIALIVKWIEGGLLENKSSAARKPSQPKFATALATDPAAKPEGPPPMPRDLLLDPPVVTLRPAAVQAITASPWAPLIAVTAQRQILLYHTETLELIGILPFPEGDPISLAFTPDARYLIVGGGVPGKSGLTVTIDITDGSRTVSSGKEFDSVLAADIRPGFDIVATGGSSKLLKLWNTHTGSLLQSVKKHTDWITALDISPDGILLSSGDRNGGVLVWEAETANEFHTLRGHQAAISALSFRADSNLLASASEDGSIRFWEMNNGGEVKKIDAHPGGVTAFAFAKNGTFITAGRDNKARLWKADFNPLRQIDLPALPTAAAIDWEGKRAFIADSSGNVHAFPVEGKNPTSTIIPTNPPTISSRLHTFAQLIANAQKKPDEAELASLRAREKSWKAAAINTDALKAAAKSEALSEQSDSALDDFHQALTELTEITTTLSGKRAERDSFAASLEKSTSSSEALPTLLALNAAVENLRDILRERENAVIAIRADIESTATSLSSAKLRFAKLRGAYLQALR